MKKAAAEIPFAGSVIDRNSHLCGFFSSDENRHKSLTFFHKFGIGVVIDIAQTHPMFVGGGILQQNPFVVPPGEFLREFRQHRPRRSNPSAAA